ncbi:MAG TPA: pilus (MSHA type) biogenesis protein MshL [Rhodocyclaceae bacterium]|nr:pilus (MSHA type) biogenesis protein MshL [Rhodocyclaceae bacterium]
MRHAVGKRGKGVFTAILLAAIAVGCAPVPPSPSQGAHITQAPARATTSSSIPAHIEIPAAPPRPRQTAPAETYSVVVNNVKASDLLFALARDAKLNIDIHPGIAGTVTLNAIDQSLPQLLTRIAKQVDMRWELDASSLAIMPDSPFLRSYRVDYVNMSREMNGSVAVTTQITSAVGGTANTTGANASGNGNNSLTKIENKAQNRFWATLEKNIKDLLHETDKLLPEGSSETVIEKGEQQTSTGLQTNISKAGTVTQSGNGGGTATTQQDGTTVVRRTTFREAASVIVNAESGAISVRATSRQHEKVREFIDQIVSSARRQVLIEATIVEVQLSNNYQQGISWSALALGRAGFQVKQAAAGNISAPPSHLLELTYANTESRFGNITSTINLLESFGTVRVLSSPKISVLNNQTAVLKVVDNSVYFTVKADTTTNQTTSTTTYTTELHSVPVGFVMNVTPQISEHDSVLLNIRPSISRIIGTVADPNPTLKAASITSSIPVIRTREMESVIRIDSGNIAVMGGLMEDVQNDQDDAVPGLHKIPGIGNLFQQRNDTRSKTELVIFLRPIVIHDAHLDGDYRQFRDQFPGKRPFSLLKHAPVALASITKAVAP